MKFTIKGGPLDGQTLEESAPDEGTLTMHHRFTPRTDKNQAIVFESYWLDRGGVATFAEYERWEPASEGRIRVIRWTANDGASMRYIEPPA